MIIRSDVEMCKNTIESLIGKRVRLTSNGGRKRLIIHDGIVEDCYPNVFTVRCTREDEKDNVVSYSYVDVLTRAVRVSVPADELKSKAC